MGIRVAYSYFLYFSEQVSCTKYFHRSCGLKDIEFIIFKCVWNLLELFLIINPTLTTIVWLTSQLA